MLVFSRDFDFIIQRIQDKLAGWRSNLLSLSGRRILIQSSSSAIADYVMQGALLPSRVCQEIDRVNCNFLWGSTPEKHKLYMVNWDKLNWKLFIGENSPWARVLRAKYLSNRSASSPWSSKGSCFQTWAAC